MLKVLELYYEKPKENWSNIIENLEKSNAFKWVDTTYEEVKKIDFVNNDVEKNFKVKHLKTDCLITFKKSRPTAHLSNSTILFNINEQNDTITLQVHAKTAKMYILFDEKNIAFISPNSIVFGLLETENQDFITLNSTLIGNISELKISNLSKLENGDLIKVPVFLKNSNGYINQSVVKNVSIFLGTGVLTENSYFLFENKKYLYLKDGVAFEVEKD